MSVSEQRHNREQTDQIRALLRGADPAVRSELASAMRMVGQYIHDGQMRMVPRGTGKRAKGNLARHLHWEVTEGGLTVRAGYINPVARKAAWYGLFFETGVKAQVVRVGFGRERRRQRLLRQMMKNPALKETLKARLSKTWWKPHRQYLLRVPARKPHYFITLPGIEARMKYSDEIDRAVHRALDRVA